MSITMRVSTSQVYQHQTVLNSRHSEIKSNIQPEIEYFKEDYSLQQASAVDSLRQD